MVKVQRNAIAFMPQFYSLSLSPVSCIHSLFIRLSAQTYTHTHNLCAISQFSREFLNKSCACDDSVAAFPLLQCSYYCPPTKKKKNFSAMRAREKAYGKLFLLKYSQFSIVFSDAMTFCSQCHQLAKYARQMAYNCMDHPDFGLP